METGWVSQWACLQPTMWCQRRGQRWHNNHRGRLRREEWRNRCRAAAGGLSADSCICIKTFNPQQFRSWCRPQSPSSVGKARPLCLGSFPPLLLWIRSWHPRNTSEDGVLQLFSNKCNVISIISISLELHTVALAGFSSILMNVVENPNLYFNGWFNGWCMLGFFWGGGD